MRIIAGEFRGRSLESVRDLSVRPTTDRAKQTIFDVLSNRIEFDGLDVLEKNAASLGCEPQCSVYQADVFWYLKNIHRTYDLVFTDPPYKLENIGVLPNAIYDSGIVRNGTYVVMEHSRESAIELDEQKYEILRKAFGQTTVLILKAIVPPAPPRM